MHSMLLCRSWSSRRVINGVWVQGHQPQSVYNEHFLEPSGTTSNHQPNRNKSAEGTGWTILGTKRQKTHLGLMNEISSEACSKAAEGDAASDWSALWISKWENTIQAYFMPTMQMLQYASRRKLVFNSIHPLHSKNTSGTGFYPRCWQPDRPFWTLNTPMQRWTALHLDSNRPE